MMEILTVGEKIKRARVYKGLTLKKLCGKDISVSKLSCIENGKVKPEEWILQTLSEKLGVDYNELNKEIDEQILENIREIERYKNIDEEEYIDRLIEYAELAGTNKYYSLGFQLTHKLFTFMIERKNFIKVISVLGLHYEFSNKTSQENRMLYYFDAATYLYENGEYLQASSYYKSIKEFIEIESLSSINLICKATFYDLKCQFYLGNYEEAYEIGKALEKDNKKSDSQLLKAQTYHMMGVLAISVDEFKYQEYIEKAYKYFGDDKLNKAEATLDFAVEFIKSGKVEKGIEYLKMVEEQYSEFEKEKHTVFLIKTAEVLVEYNVDELSQSYCENALNLAIEVNKPTFIEKAYYLKSKYLIKNGNLFSAEMYVNLSLDSLKKFANLKQIYERYMEMGKFYYDMNNINDSVKYLSLARSMKDKL